MYRNKLINSETFNEIYFLFIKTLIGKLIKKGKKFKALNLYKNIKENIKFSTKKEKEVSFIFLIALLNSMPKVAFKEIRLGSQKKDLPIPINEKKQVLTSVESFLKISKNKKKLEFNKLINFIILSYQNNGIIIRNKKLKYKKAIINKMLLNIFLPKKKNWKENYDVSEKNNYQIFKNKTSL
jgi:ribosomal protein S7